MSYAAITFVGIFFVLVCFIGLCKMNSGNKSKNIGDYATNSTYNSETAQ